MYGSGQVWIDQDIAASPISTSDGCVRGRSPGSVSSSRSSSFIGPLLPPSPSLACPLCPYSSLRAAVRDVGCVDALISLPLDLHPPAIIFSLTPTTTVTARERDLAGC